GTFAAEWVRRVGRDRQYTGVQAAEEGGDVLQARAVEQQRSIAGGGDAPQAGGQGAGLPVEVGVSQVLFFGFAVHQEGVADMIGVGDGAPVGEGNHVGDWGR